MTQHSSPSEAIAYIHDGMHVFANESYINLFHYSDLDEVLATPFMDMVADEFRKDLKLSLRTCQNAGKAADEEPQIARMDVVALDANKAAFPANLCLKPVFYEGEHCLQVVFITKHAPPVTTSRIIVKKKKPQAQAALAPVTSWLSEDSITAALENDELVLMYHPVVSSFGREPEFYDIHPCLYGPQKEIGNAQQIAAVGGHSLGQQLDRWAFSRAIRLMENLRTQGKTQQFQLTVTASTAADPTFSDWLGAQLAECRVKPDALVVNMREADVLANIPASKALIKSLQECGSRFCISGFSNREEIAAVATECKVALVRFDNDIGEEHSLHMLPLHDLKQFVDKLHQEHIKVIAADVQDQQTVDGLWLAEVDLLQGALFQKEPQELHAGSFRQDVPV